MTQTDKARFVVEFDTAAAEAALRNLHATAAGGGGGGGGRQGGSTVNREGGGAPQGGSAFGRAQAPVGPSGGIGMAGMAALALAFKESIREVGGAAVAFTDAANRSALAATGLREGPLSEVRAAQATSSQMKSMLGVAADTMSPAQITRQFNALNEINLMKARGSVKIDKEADRIIMAHSAPFFLAVASVALHKGLTGAEPVRGLKIKGD